MAPLSGQVIDLSSNQHAPGTGAFTKPEMMQAKAAGVIGVIVKATQATTYTNPFYAGDMTAAQAAGLPTAAYHFMGSGTPQAEAAYFVKVAGAKARVLDVETSQNTGWMATFLASLPGTLEQHMTYGSASTLPRSLNSLLWPAAYGQGWPGFGEMWQYTDAWKCPGIGLVDASQWYGTQAEFDAFFGVGPPPGPGPQVGSGAVFVINPTQDQFWATCRFIWYDLRSDPWTQVDANNYWLSWNLPVAQSGFGQHWDLVVAKIHDTAGGNLK